MAQCIYGVKCIWSTTIHQRPRWLAGQLRLAWNRPNYLNTRQNILLGQHEMLVCTLRCAECRAWRANACALEGSVSRWARSRLARVIRMRSPRLCPDSACCCGFFSGSIAPTVRLNLGTSSRLSVPRWIVTRRPQAHLTAMPVAFCQVSKNELALNVSGLDASALLARYRTKGTPRHRLRDLGAVNLFVNALMRITDAGLGIQLSWFPPTPSLKLKMIFILVQILSIVVSLLISVAYLTVAERK